MTFPFDKPEWRKTVPQCILTGIRVINEGLVARADLHIVGDAFILNCATDNSGDTFWGHPTPLDLDPRVCSVSITGAEFFERRGVIVIHRTQAILSDGAFKYMKASQ